MCGEGFYGDLTKCQPELIGITNGPCLCRPCQCHGNVDPNAIGNCDATTGTCLKCTHGTTGRFCDRCLPGYYGVAVIPGRRSNCTRCDCDSRGTKPTAAKIGVGVKPEIECGADDGQCRCVDHVTGRRCDTPEPGFRWWKNNGDIAKGVDSKEPPRFTAPSLLLPPGAVIQPPPSGFIGIPPGGAEYEIVDPITGNLVPVPSNGGDAKIVKIPPGAKGYRVIEGTSGKVLDIPIGGTSWVIDTTSGRVVGIPSRWRIGI